MENLRVTANVGKVLNVFLANPGQDHYGYDLMRATGLRSGNLYPILVRLEGSCCGHTGGWIEGHQEDMRPGTGRPPRRYYRLTPHGYNAARRELDGLRTSLGETIVYGPHCAHDDCGWIECGAVPPTVSGISHACRLQASCPHCGPTSPEWPRLAAEWVNWCTERFGTANLAELAAIEPMYFNVLATAELVASNPVAERLRPLGVEQGGALHVGQHERPA